MAMGFFKSRIEKKAQEYTAQAVQRAESSDDPIERTLGPGGADQVREAMAQFERFGIHLDADSALGLTPSAVVPGASTESSASPAGATPPAAGVAPDATTTPPAAATPPAGAAVPQTPPAASAPTAAAGPAASAGPAPSAAGDPIGEIERLAALHTSGALTDEEFAAAKKSVIGE
jgi:Short C-terminal domain